MIPLAVIATLLYIVADIASVVVAVNVVSVYQYPVGSAYPDTPCEVKASSSIVVAAGCWTSGPTYTSYTCDAGNVNVTTWTDAQCTGVATQIKNVSTTACTVYSETSESATCATYTDSQVLTITQFAGDACSGTIASQVPFMLGECSSLGTTAYIYYIIGDQLHQGVYPDYTCTSLQSGTFITLTNTTEIQSACVGSTLYNVGYVVPADFVTASPTTPPTPSPTTTPTRSTPVPTRRSTIKSGSSVPSFGVVSALMMVLAMALVVVC